MKEYGVEYGCTGLTKQGQKETSKEKQIMLATLYVPLVISSTCLGVTVCDGEETKKRIKFIWIKAYLAAAYVCLLPIPTYAILCSCCCHRTAKISSKLHNKIYLHLIRTKVMVDNVPLYARIIIYYILYKMDHAVSCTDTCMPPPVSILLLKKGLFLIESTS